ncbi:MAG: N-acetylmuramoyl-L-alanine amidase [Firmicutes bacterium]|nr:N-acetylmuramoyl-L-alanine amidase [Bacillota bacterium]
MTKITRMFLTPNKYSRPQIPLKKVKKIAVHYVGNAGSTAKGNRDYFESLKNGRGVYASSHYIIGLEGEIIQCIPENEVSYDTNEANSYSISIENCHPLADGKFDQKTLESLKELCADICIRYGLDPTKDIIRHYDVSGKRCPLWWVIHPQEFVKFKKSVKDMLKGGENMEAIKKLEEEVQSLKKSREKVYNNIDDIPDWGRDTVNRLMTKGCLKGTDKGLDISETMLRILVINDRAGVYDIF